MNAKRRTSTVDDIASECIAVRLRMLNRVVTNIYDQALRPLGLRVSQMNILVAAAKTEIARPAEVCRRLHLDGSTLSRNVERMKSRGWLAVVPDEDGRAQPLRLTKEGRKLLERAFPVWKQAQGQARDLLGDAMVRQVQQAVTRLKTDTHTQ